MKLLTTALLLLMSLFASATDDMLLVAVASNFLGTAQQLQQDYRDFSGQSFELSAASTGKLYTQILYGAPYDVFLAADVISPSQLEAEGLAVAGSRQTYAIGRLLLWSADPSLGANDCHAALLTLNFRHLAMANSNSAPYGLAARETLQRLGLWRQVQSKLVTGENVAQAYQYIASGNAQLGFIEV